MYDIPINTPLTDSFSLKIPFLDCEVLDERLTSQTFIYYESLDAIDTEPSPPKPMLIQGNGITIRIGLAHINIWDNENKIHVPTEFINLTVSSKLLKHNYFNGINKNNIKDLYNEFLSFEVFFCTYDVFLKGYISDIDICFNRYVNNPVQFDEALTLLYDQCDTKKKHLHKICQPNNIGLTFNKRNTAKPSIPFIKFYHKEFELLSKSAEFYNTFLFPYYAEQIKGLTRVEVTIRNYEHKARLEKFKILPNFRTLEEYLEFTPLQLYDVLIFSLNSYIEKKVRKKAPNLTPTDHIIFELLQNCIMSGYDFKSLESIVLTFKGNSSASTLVQHSRMRKKIKELFDLLIHKDLKLIKKTINNAHVLEYLNFLNLNI